MARFAPITRPDAEVNVTTAITQKMREEFRLLAFTKEHTSIKALLSRLIQNYLHENMEVLNAIAGLREEPAVSEQEPVSKGEPIAVN